MVNDGIDWSSEENVYWKHDVRRFEALKVILHGNSEFEASNVTIQVKCDNYLIIFCFLLHFRNNVINPISSLSTLDCFQAP